MPAINNGQRVRHRGGGSIEITDLESATVYTVSGVEEESVEWDDGGYAVIEDSENGQPSDERRGDARRSRVRCRYKHTSGMTAAAGLYGLLEDQVKAVDDGKPRLWDVVWKQTDHSGDTTGDKKTWSNCYVNRDSLKFRTGVEHNTVECEFVSRSVAGAIGTF